jgi:hypothetical protein
MWRLGLAALAAFVASAQQGSLAGPVTGYVYDAPSRALVPVLGIPGAAVIGGPLNLGYDLASAWVSPGLDSAVAVASDGSVHLLRLSSGTVAELPPGGLSVFPDEVVFSPSGTAALMYGGGKLQAITGLPGSPAAGGAFEFGTAEGGRTKPVRRPHTSLAISDDGSLILAAAGASVLVFDADGSSRKLAGVAAGALVAFAPGGLDAVVVDRSAGVVVYRGLKGAAVPILVAPPDDTMPSPSGVAFSADGSRLFVADSAAKTVAAFDIGAGTKSNLGCQCTPAGLARMGSVFRLNDGASGPLWLLDAGAGEARIVFVPAGR